MRPGQQDEGYDQGDSQVVERGADTCALNMRYVEESQSIVILRRKERRRGVVYI